jgi:glycosyltransferase involved in cell wall biosynthesis
MKISIVTLSYNQQTFLQEAIDSVLGQDFPDVEYIVVDPGSTDGSREFIRSYGARIAQLFEPDKGAADGLNKGFSRATGDVFGFLNADDYLLPGALRRVTEFFEAHPQCDIVMGNGYIVDVEGRTLRHVRTRDFTVRRYLCGGVRWIQQATFFRRKAFCLSPGFNTENRTSWDGELFVSMVNTGAKVGYLDADLAAFRIHNASISGSRRLSDEYLKDCRRIFRQICGRDWRASDDVQRFLYRIEGLLIQIKLWPRYPARKRGAA